ncbi:MAG TPA: HPF/RaiA family ribosome-associated protein [Bryobacteraceae bacterium]|jgi:putative sigma-54 modulation protein|nr:HPF/RaiA family ribosome-associated protein [Bryobacteraceae bacterium]
MNISYAGKRPELSPDQTRKLDQKWDKLAKLIEWKGQREAHVVITTERHLTNVEVTCNYYDHPLVGIGSGPDYFTAACAALEKLEKQALKVRTKFRDTKRGPKDKSLEGASEPGAVVAAEENEPVEAEPVVRIYRVNHHEQRKPMTLDEAILEIEDRPYIVYRDADKECISVLIRRPDGNFDLIEG